ncbi:MAG: hypothetical protein ACRC92_26415 [Peptostreptococcaceae bacterium]
MSAIETKKKSILAFFHNQMVFRGNTVAMFKGVKDDKIELGYEKTLAIHKNGFASKYKDNQIKEMVEILNEMNMHGYGRELLDMYGMLRKGGDDK